MNDRVSQVVDNALAWAVAAVLGGIGWLVRRVFTNQKQIELLQADLNAREKQRNEDREQVADIKRSVERIENRLMQAPGPVQHWNDRTQPPR